ncbi:FecR family protein [Chitinophaga sp. XS-30]|uniref:FecR family protein n=1 Tax=Chitinophaga sp. XS-30 TaxID=2604421 RepID=UPI0011DCD7DA|nr:FecR domain-containing protein [Chitinophaga sp. XS-30]QEH42667.1 DUF4974 domain-containing protein [Chitinophaga sp. XS-30]
MQHKSVDTALLRQYFEGKCNREQLKTIRQYLEDPAYSASLEEFMQQHWQEDSGANADPLPLQARYRQFRDIVSELDITNNQKPAAKTRSLRAPWRFAAAAILIGLLIAAGISLWYAPDLHKTQNNTAWVDMKNEAGKRTSFMLPDSSLVFLNAASHLRYNTEYGKTNRELLLEGEAYFVVAPGGEHPFAVKTGSLTTIDISTEFNIRHFGNQADIEVTVAKGSVKVMNDSRDLAVLHHREQLKFDSQRHQFSTALLANDLEEVGGWRNGILAFRKSSLRDVAAELERYYGVQIIFDRPEVSAMLLTTTLHNATLEEAMDIISFTTGLKITLESAARLRIW